MFLRIYPISMSIKNTFKLAIRYSGLSESAWIIPVGLVSSVGEIRGASDVIGSQKRRPVNLSVDAIQRRQKHGNIASFA